LQPLSSPALEHVVRTCLAKDPDERWQTAKDIALQLKWISEVSSQPGIPATVVNRRKWRERVAWSLAALFFVAALIVAAFAYLSFGGHFCMALISHSRPRSLATGLVAADS